MNKKSKVLVILGVVLVALSFALLIFVQISSKQANETSKKIIAEIETIIPQRVEGVSDGFSSLEMPVLEIYNKDIVGIVEIPKFNVELPVENEKTSRLTNSFPVRVNGSVYVNSLTISGSDKSGQFDCVDKLEVGDTVKFVDMTGAEFDFKISEFYRSSAFDSTPLIIDSDLVLIIKEEYSFETVVVFCTDE